MLDSQAGRELRDRDAEQGDADEHHHEAKEASQPGARHYVPVPNSRRRCQRTPGCLKDPGEDPPVNYRPASFGEVEEQRAEGDEADNRCQRQQHGPGANGGRKAPDGCRRVTVREDLEPSIHVRHAEVHLDLTAVCETDPRYGQVHRALADGVHQARELHLAVVPLDAEVAADRLPQLDVESCRPVRGLDHMGRKDGHAHRKRTVGRLRPGRQTGKRQCRRQRNQACSGSRAPPVAGRGSTLVAWRAGARGRQGSQYSCTQASPGRSIERRGWLGMVLYSESLAPVLSLHAIGESLRPLAD